MKIERSNNDGVFPSFRAFDVVDDPQTASWRFWQDHFCGDWEMGTLTELGSLLKEDRDYLDIGAWVGPTVLWGAPLARRCVAVEPDPIALKVLRENVDRNCSNVTIIPAAVSDRAGTAELETGGDWGDSMSSLQRRTGASCVTVPTVTLESVLVDLDPAVVKIDIEGGEGLLLSPNEDLLHDIDCPIILGIHWPWLPADQAAEVRRVIEGFRIVHVLDDDPNFPTVLLK